MSQRVMHRLSAFLSCSFAFVHSGVLLFLFVSSLPSLCSLVYIFCCVYLTGLLPQQHQALFFCTGVGGVVGRSVYPLVVGGWSVGRSKRICFTSVYGCQWTCISVRLRPNPQFTSILLHIMHILLCRTLQQRAGMTLLPTFL